MLQHVRLGGSWRASLDGFWLAVNSRSRGKFFPENKGEEVRSFLEILNTGFAEYIVSFHCLRRRRNTVHYGSTHLVEFSTHLMVSISVP